MIPIIAGWGKDAKPIAYIGIIKCPNCRNYDHFRLYEIAKKARVYFVPVAKWGKKYYMVCNMCEALLEVNESEKDQLLRESVDLPPHEQAAEIWDKLDSTVSMAMEKGYDLDEELKKAVEQLENQYPKSHVEYICSVYAECLQDEDQPE